MSHISHTESYLEVISRVAWVAGGELLVDVVGDVAGLEPPDGDGVALVAVGLLLLLGHRLVQLQVVHLGAEGVDLGLGVRNGISVISQWGFIVSSPVEEHFNKTSMNEGKEQRAQSQCVPRILLQHYRVIHHQL